MIQSVVIVLEWVVSSKEMKQEMKTEKHANLARCSYHGWLMNGSELDHFTLSNMANRQCWKLGMLGGNPQQKFCPLSAAWVLGLNQLSLVFAYSLLNQETENSPSNGSQLSFSSSFPGRSFSWPRQRC